MQAIPAAASQEMNNAQLRNNGQQTGLLGGSGAIDGSVQSLWNAVDPGNISGHSSGSGSVGNNLLQNVFDPGNVFGFNQAANPNAGASNGANASFPNLGAASLIPQMPQGSFGAIHNGAGPYNNMAAQGAGGQQFNPGQHGVKPTQTAVGQAGMNGMGPMMAKPVSPIAVGTKRY